jgi:hypothetical protein
MGGGILPIFFALTILVLGALSLACVLHFLRCDAGQVL